jgi:hypothetical protein
LKRALIYNFSGRFSADSAQQYQDLPSAADRLHGYNLCCVSGFVE